MIQRRSLAATSLLPRQPMTFQGNAQRLGPASPLISVDFPDTPREFNTQPGLLVQLLGDGSLNFCNSNTRAAIPEIGPWVIHLQTEASPYETRTADASVVLSKETLVKAFQQFSSLKIWFTHPRIDGYKSPTVTLQPLEDFREFLVIQPVRQSPPAR